MKNLALILSSEQEKYFKIFDTHKSLLMVGQKSIIIRQIEHLEEIGVDEVYIVVNKINGGQVRDFLSKSGSIKCKINFIEINNTLSEVESLLYSLNQIRDEADNYYVILNNLIFEKNPFLKFEKKEDINFLCDKSHIDNKFSGSTLKIKKKIFLKDLKFDDNDFNYHFSGVSHFRRDALSHLIKIADNAHDLKELFSEISKNRPVHISQIEKMQWFNIISPEMLMRAEMFFRSREAGKTYTEVNLERLNNINTDLSFEYAKKAKTRILVERGLMNNLSKYELMAPERTSSNHVIITDEIVDELFGDIVLKQMEEAGYKVKKLVCPVGEGAKSMGVFNNFAEVIISMGIDEHSIIFALGGGVVANLSGMLAATLYRGIGLVHIPTTVMNMIDVSISLKQGINGAKGKNLIGSYYQPLLVLIDPTISIPDWLVRDGVSEAIKHAVCQDKDFFDKLINFKGDLSDVDFREYLIKHTINLKIQLMRDDMFEDHQAMILQYGHEIGHAVEFLSGFKLTHGQAIAIGMRASAELAYVMDVTNGQTVKDHIDLIKHYELPYKIPGNLDKQAIFASLVYNKKIRGKEIRIVLPEFTGKAWKIKGEYGIPCPDELIMEAIDRSYRD